MNDIGIIVFFIAMITSGQVSLAYRILLVVPIPSSSHAILGDACAKTLLGAGHEVVYVTALPNRLQKHPQLMEVDVSSNAKFFPTDVVNLTHFLDNPTQSVRTVDLLEHTTLYSVETVKHEAFQRILNDGKKFDLVIAEWMFTEMYAGLPALLDCPFVWLSTMESHSLILRLVDEEPNPTYNADIGVNHIVPFSFSQRVEQLVMRLLFTAYRSYYIYFEETKHFNNLYEPMMKKLGKNLPSYKELMYNASLVLSNSHVSLGQVTRLPQNFIPIGGYHIDSQVKPLSEDMQNIMDKAKNGVIYFSMGSILKSKDFPQKLKMELLNMFGSLKQTVLWKFEEDFADLPNNVHVLKWASQQSILNHPNCVLFITHGGLLSLAEAVHYGVPVIGIPGFADQFVNVMRAEQKGFAKKVHLSYNLAEDLRKAIEEIVGNSQYKENVKLLSFIYHDRPTQPRTELVHWVEHVIKTRGAPMLRSPALNVTFYQKFYLDLALLIFVILCVVRILLKRLFHMICQKSTSANVLNSKKLE